MEGVVSPQLEMGAFEALWATKGVSSFKQFRDKLKSEGVGLASELVGTDIALDFYEKTIKHLEKSGIKNFGVRIDGTFDYPKKLHDADHPLFLFYFQGIWDLAFSPGVAVVGTRKPSERGKKRTEQLVKKLVKKGHTIYSGLASGIDTVAHKTAINAGGKTVARHRHTLVPILSQGKCRTTEGDSFQSSFNQSSSHY